MLRIRLFLFLCIFSLVNSYAQKKNFSFDLGSSAGYISPEHIPFWLRSNQFGSVPLDNASLSLIGAIRKDYNHTKSRIFDWGAAVEGRVNIGTKSQFTIIEGYAKMRISVFEIRAGRSREIMGLCDTSLTSGSFAVSGNALSIPKVQVSIPEFYSLPLVGKLFAFKGNYSQGWIGKSEVNFYGNVLQMETWFHQKSLYGMFGKPSWKWKLYTGFCHQVIWGSEYGEFFSLTNFKTYLHVLTGRLRIGESLGSIDLGYEYNFKYVRLLAYHQFFYDGGALYYFANTRDGLSGLSLENRKYSNQGFRWRKILLEVFYSKSQGGEPWSVYRYIRSGSEDYYNNWQYMQGWSYNDIGIGNPFISSRIYTREGLPSNPVQYFINNRVVAFHAGFEGSLHDWYFILKTSYSLNYGTYSTIDIFPETKQFSAYLDASRELKNGFNVGFTWAFDAGELYYDSYGVIVRVGKSF